MSRLGRRAPWVALLLGAVFPMLRVLAHPATTLPGDAYGDVFKHAWAYWHTLASLPIGHPIETPFLNAPAGAVLLDVMLLPALVMAPVTLVAGPVVSANLWVVLSLLAIGLATYALALEVTGSRLGATTAGLLAQGAPFLYGYPLESGVHERLTVWVFPLMVLGVLKASKDGSWRWGLAAVAAVGASTMGCQVYGVFAVIVLAFTAPAWLRRGAHYKVLVPTILGIGAILGGVYVVVHDAATHGLSASIQMGRTDLTFGGLPSLDVATPWTLLDPRVVSTSIDSKALGDRLVKLVYLGWVPIAAAVAGLVAGRREARATIVAGVLMAVLAMGSHIAGVANPLHALLARVLPTYGALPPVFQQVAAFGPLAAVGAAALIARIDHKALSLGLAGALVAGWTVERALALPVPLLLTPTSAEVPAIYEQVDGPLVEVPREWGPDLAPGLLFMAQTVHEQPLPVTINVGGNAFEAMPSVRYGMASDWSAEVACLEAHGFAWLAYHRDWVGEHVNPDDQLRALTATLGAPAHDDGTIALFRLSPETTLEPPYPWGGRGYPVEREGYCPGR